MEARDYYTILGITKGAGEDEIRKAYRKLARKYHPDVNKDESVQDTFKEINEAYETLKDPEKRKQYDMYGPNWQRVNSGGQESYGGFGNSGGFRRAYSFNSNGEFGTRDSFSDIFESIFSGSRGNPFGDVDEFSSRSNADEAELEVTVADLFSQAEKTFTLQTVEPSQNGSYGQVNKTLKVKIPAGISNGSAIRLTGQGSFDPHTGINRDLILRVTVRQDSRFTVKGFNLHTVVAVSPWEAALGASIPVETVDGSVSLTIPAGSQSGKKFRIRGKGLPGKNGSPGDIIVEVEVRIPEKMTEVEKRLLKELAEKSHFNPREHSSQKSG